MKWLKSSVIILAILALFVPGSSQNDFGSIRSLRKIRKNNDSNSEDIKAKAKEILIEYEKIASIICKFDKHCTIEDVEVIVANPLNHVCLMHIHANEWEEIKKALKSIDDKTIELAIFKLKSLLNFLSEGHKNFLGYMLEIQNTYELDIDILSNGIVRGIPLSLRLSPDECVYMGVASYDDGEYGRGAAWFREVLKKVRMGERCRFASQTDVIQKLSVDTKEDVPKNFSYTTYKRLCRSKTTSSGKSRRLTCYYIRNKDPFFIFAPTKCEKLSVNSDVLLYHDVIPNAEIKKIRKMASARKIYPCTTLAYNIFFVKYEFPSLVWKIKDSTDTLSDHFFNAFLFSYFSPFHYTTFSKTNPTARVDKLQSEFNAILFLSNVEHGGHTVINRPPISVKPKIGSILFWRNEGGVKMAECPVLIGEKHVAQLLPTSYDIVKMFHSNAGENMYEAEVTLNTQRSTQRIPPYIRGIIR